MAKKMNPALENVLLREEVERLRRENYIIKGFTMQQCLDITILTLHRHYGFGPERNKNFERDWRKMFVAYAELCLDDGKDDASIVYTKEKMDRAMRAAVGDDLLPFDDRYKIDQIYTVDTKDIWRGSSILDRRKE